MKWQIKNKLLRGAWNLQYVYSSILAIGKKLIDYVRLNPVQTGIILGIILTSLFMFSLSGSGNYKLSDNSANEYLSKFDPIPRASASEQGDWELYIENRNLTYIPGEVLGPSSFFLSSVDKVNIIYDEDHITRSMEELALQEVKPALKPDGSFGEINMSPEEFCLALAVCYSRYYNETEIRALGVSLDEDDKPEKYCLVLGAGKNVGYYDYPFLPIPTGPFVNSNGEAINFGFPFAVVTTPGKGIFDSEIPQERLFCCYPEETIEATNILINMSEMKAMIGHPRSDFVDGIDNLGDSLNEQAAQTQSCIPEESQENSETAKKSPWTGTLTTLSIVGGVSYLKRRFGL